MKMSEQLEQLASLPEQFPIKLKGDGTVISHPLFVRLWDAVKAYKSADHVADMNEQPSLAKALRKMMSYGYAIDIVEVDKRMDYARAKATANRMAAAKKAREKHEEQSRTRRVAAWDRIASDAVILSDMLDAGFVEGELTAAELDELARKATQLAAALRAMKTKAAAREYQRAGVTA